VPVFSTQTALSDALTRLASAPAPPERNSDVVVDTGVLTCGDCGAWYPIIAAVPEVLSDHLRDGARDRRWLEETAPRLPGELVALWRRFEPRSAEDPGAHHKLAEIALPAKITDGSFWGPGYASPFNLWTPEHTWHLIRNFVVAEPLLELSRGHVVLDVGSGYSWTTEWLLRSGYEPIGIDICRAYLEIAIARVGPNRPHLLVADAERLPIRSGSMHAVLGFEAFHHVPDRPAAMREFNRVLMDGRPVVLVEPGGAHEHAAVSIEAMEKYGTLERGMDLRDVVAYAEGSGLGDCREHYLQRVAVGAEFDAVPPSPPISLVANNVYTLRKGGTPSVRSRPAPPPPEPDPLPVHTPAPTPVARPEPPPPVEPPPAFSSLRRLLRRASRQ
jgi:SAM-dependent methyltransferase/uncharacterized protein YbaR (Trm112 family)